MNICTKCLTPDTRPDVEFIDGVCSACISHEQQKKINWKLRRQDLLQLFERQKPNGTGYDCIVASSGGKDSHAQVLDLIELGVRPLLVTATTCYPTLLGQKNINNLKRYAATIEVTPNQEVRAKLNRLGLRLVGDISWPEHVAIFTTPIRMAAALGIPLVFYGENPQAAYGGPLDAVAARQMTQRWVSEFGGFLGLRPADMVGIEGLTQDQMKEYQPPSAEALKRSNVEAHFLGQYIGPWDGRRNANRAVKVGFQYVNPWPNANWWPFENLDNAMTGLHDYMMYTKYGLSRAATQLSVDIRNGRINRQTALDWVKKCAPKLPETYAGVPLSAVLNRIGVSRDELNKIVSKFSRKG